MSDNHGIRRMISIGALASALMVSGITAAPDAEAGTSLKIRAYNVALAQKGDPYRWGHAGPNKFDCSGLVFYSYKRVGKKLPRTAQQQFNKSIRVSAKKRSVGDLVFIGSSSKNIWHVGIYAGSGKMVNANTGSYRGRKVVVAPIREYGGEVYYGRIK